MTVLPETLHCDEFVNCDAMAKGLNPLNPDSAKYAAGRLMLSRIKKLISQQADFAIETTLATKSYHTLFQQAQTQGYTVNLIYFWLSSPELAIKRVAERVSHGGHHVDEKTLRRRYTMGLHNLFNLYCPIVDYFLIIDNSIVPAEIVAEGKADNIQTYNQEKFNRIKSI